MKIVRSALGGMLVAMAASSLVNGVALARDRDRDEGHDRAPRCEVLTVEVTAQNTLVITGTGLTSRHRGHDRAPEVSLGGTAVDVLSDPAPTSTEIVADVGSLVAGLAAPKDFLLKIKRSRRDDDCASRMVTVAPRTKSVFVTSAAYDGAFSHAPDQCLGKFGTARADCICNTLAGNASPPLAGQFVAWLSVTSSSAVGRLPADGGPWYNLNPDGRQLVAATPADLTSCGTRLGGSCIDHAIGFTENGDALAAAVWTGVAPGNPTNRQTCDDWSSSSSVFGGWTGNSSQSDTPWTSVSPDPVDCDSDAHLYCFQL